jgi:hypothetical protein
VRVSLLCTLYFVVESFYSDRTAPFGEAGLRERRRFAGTTSRSPSTKYVRSRSTDPTRTRLVTKHRNIAMRRVCVAEEVDGEVMQL